MGKGSSHCRGQAVVLMEESTAFPIDHSGRQRWANENRRPKEHMPGLSVQPWGSLAPSLAFLLGSLDPGSGASSLAPGFQRIASHELQTHSLSPFFCSSGSGLSLWLFPASPFFPWNRLALAKASAPNPALPDQNEPIPSPLCLPTPPHRTPVVQLRLALSHFPIDDSWIRRGEAPAARAGGELVATAPPWPHSVLESS